MKQRPAAEDPEEPRHIQLAEKLAQKIRAFNANAAARSLLTGEETRQLEEIDALAYELANAETLRNGLPSKHTAAIETLARKYRAMNTGFVDLQVAGETVSSPALESGAVRAAVASIGNDLVAELGRYLEGARDREAQSVEMDRVRAETLAFARTIPEIAPFVAALEASIALYAGHESAGVAFTMLECSRRSLEASIAYAEAFGSSVSSDVLKGAALKLHDLARALEDERRRAKAV